MASMPGELRFNEPTIVTILVKQPSKLENKYPDCIYMNLEGRVNPHVLNSQLNVIVAEEMDLYLTINFNEHEEQLPPFGCVKFGLTGGEILINLNNGKIPYVSRASGEIALSVQKERQIQGSSEKQNAIEANGFEKPGIKANVSVKESSGITDKFQFSSSQITTKGSEENPSWVFEVQTSEVVLRGLFREEKLGTIYKIIHEDPCQAVATFSVSKKNVRLTDVEGMLAICVEPTKRGIIKALLIKTILNKLKPYLSLVELKYD